MRSKRKFVFIFTPLSIDIADDAFRFSICEIITKSGMASSLFSVGYIKYRHRNAYYMDLFFARFSNL
jgi:hypothetical protein